MNEIKLESFYAEIAEELKLRPEQVAMVHQLLKDDCTVPFIARYRKERTGNLDEVAIRSIEESVESIEAREARRVFVLESIEKQEKLTPELKNLILKANTLAEIEDLYAPYKSKKKTKAQIALEKGVGELADLIWDGACSHQDFQGKLTQFLETNSNFQNAAEVDQALKAVFTENIVHYPGLKVSLRESFMDNGVLTTEQKKDAEKIKDFQKFRDYFEYTQKVKDLLGDKKAHQFLAVKRGHSLKILKYQIEIDRNEALGIINRKVENNIHPDFNDFINTCKEAAWDQYLSTSLDLEMKTVLKKHSDEAAINVFGKNLKALLLQPYLGPKAVLGIDPAVRTGCKIVVVDNTGKLLEDTVVYPHPPQKKKEESLAVLEALIQKYEVEYVAIGNGTYGRETLEILEEELPSYKEERVKLTMISEAGASVYSASEIARKEFPDKDTTVRGAVSIARRFQDPLAELVKIDPKSIGVGQYQHDVNQTKLKKSLEGVVEDCVNTVGVDVNTASAPLLSHISGIGPTLAGNITKFREENGIFKKREELLKVGRLSDKVFQQAAGFLRVYQGDNPLDQTFIHPENYPTLISWCEEKQKQVKDLLEDKEVQDALENDKMLEETIGTITFKDILKSLRSKRQDPRDVFKTFAYRRDIKGINDVKIGETYPGVVRNMTKFGAFIDIGIKESGLVHLSEMANHFVEDPMDVLKLGQQVQARVIEVDLDRGRIGLSLKDPSKALRDGQTRKKSGTQGSHKKGSRPHNKDQRGKTEKRKPAHQKELRNNAFAALKGFKVK